MIARLQPALRFRSALPALGSALLLACTGNLESSGGAPVAGLGANSPANAAAGDAGSQAPRGSGSSGAAGVGVAAELPLWSGSIGSWCGPAETQTVWLVARPEASACLASSQKVYSSEAEDTSLGLTVELDALELASLPATLTAPARYCAGGGCVDVQVSLQVESYSSGQPARGTWSFTPPGQAELKGRLEASWCNWDQLLPAHPEGERLARALSIREVSVYQGVKVPIARDMQTISARNADLVQQREAMVRVFVDPAPGFQSRVITARITLQDEEGEPRRFEQTMTVIGPSEEMDGDSTFNIELPKDAFGPTTQYSVELREVSRCTALDGVPVGARFPEAGLEAVGARYTGPVKVMLVPVRYDADGSGRLPDTSQAQLEQMTKRLYSMYPTSEVVLSLHEPVSTELTNLEDMLDQMRQLRDTDSPPSDLSYYGLVQQADSFRDYCQKSCTTGIAGFGSMSGTASAGMGVAFLETAASTFVHELGHIYRRPHSPCGGAAGPDESYPYAEANLGSYGYDIQTRELFDPATHVDFMSYCSPEWISDYNYQLILERMVVVNQRASMRRLPAPDAPSAYRTLLVDSAGRTRWGLDLHPQLEPPGDPISVDVLDALGNVVEQITAYQEDSAEGQRALFVPAAHAGWHALRAPGLVPVELGGVTRNKPFRRLR